MEFLNTLTSTIVMLVGFYFVGLAVIVFVRRESAKRFLESFASTRTLHFIELIVRFVVGAAFVFHAPRMKFSMGFSVFGWVLIATTLILLIVPWSLHRRFANWSVGLATKSIGLLGVGSLIIGGVLLYSLFSN